MALRQTFNIGNKSFQTKAEFKNFVKAILNRYELNCILDTTDLKFISELLRRHPEYEKKVGSGIKSILIKMDGNWGKTRCFHIQRIDGSETDFSYIHCIDNDTSNEPMRMFKQSARSAIQHQIVSHLTNYLNRTKASDNTTICQKSLIRIPIEQATVDHIPPLTFDSIVIDFINNNSIEPAQTEYIGFGDNEYNKQFKEENMRKAFSNYHRLVAKLRVISKQENLTQKKKNFDLQLKIDF